MNSPFLVTAQWLSEHLNDKDLIVVDARMSPPALSPKKDIAAAFAASHIPGAVYFDIDNVADKNTQLPHMLPTAEAFSAAVGALGISDKHKIVFYDDGNLFSAPRAWWTFRTFGAQQVFVLDAGLDGWIQQGYAIETGVANPQPQQFTSQFAADRVVNQTQVHALLGDDSVQIVDARASARFQGKAPEPRPGLHSGHIPGSLNLPYTDLLADGHFKSLAELEKTFAAQGIDLQKPIVVSCGSGVTAAVLALGLHSLQIDNVRLYDGSWTEWGDVAADLPIARS